MPAERTTMRQVREVLRLQFAGGVPIREIGLDGAHDNQALPSCRADLAAFR